MSGRHDTSRVTQHSPHAGACAQEDEAGNGLSRVTDRDAPTGRPWVFSLVPQPDSEAGSVAARVHDALVYADRLNMPAVRVVVELDASAALPHEAAALRRWLKKCGRRLGLRASWPADDGTGLNSGGPDGE